MSEIDVNVVLIDVADGETRIRKALELAIQWGQYSDSVDHKVWVVDSIVRLLAGDQYDRIIREAKDGHDGPDTYRWDTGRHP